MVTPRTATEIALMNRALLDAQRAGIVLWPLVFPRLMLGLSAVDDGRRAWLQRPHTGDMMQMCVDLGIDVPDFQPVIWDGKTFRIEKPRPETMQQFRDLYVEKWEIPDDL